MGMLQRLLDLSRGSRPRYGKIEDGDGDGDGDGGAGSRGCARLVSRRVKGLAAAIVVALVMASVVQYLAGSDATQSSSPPSPPPSSPPSSPPPQPSSRDARLHVVLPASSPRTDLCKLIASSLAAGYPPPAIINWGLNHRDVFGKVGGPHLAKVSGLLAYLDDMVRADADADADRLSDDDIILVMDAYDAWIQLPPEVLLTRYHAANRAADARLASQWPGSDHPDEIPMRQTIIFSTQKTCFPPPSSGSRVHCDAVPQSPLRPDLYGPDTDSDAAVSADHPHDVRPRYLNSGAMMGPVGDMRRYLRRVLDKMNLMLATAESRVYSDQGIFAEIFGEQEIYRAWLRSNPAAAAAPSRDRLSDDEATSMIDRDFEHHVGLDYQQDLFATTVFAERDGDVVNLSNQSAIDDLSASLGIAPTRLAGVPLDLEHAHHPLDNLNQPSSQQPHSWADSPLYADFFTTSVPVVVHHNAHMDGLKQRRVWWWDRMWFFPLLRDLVSQRLGTATAGPLARVRGRHGDEVVYWPSGWEAGDRLPRIYEAGVSAVEGLRAAGFDEVCASEDDETPWYDEVFRDGRGGI